MTNSYSKNDFVEFKNHPPVTLQELEFMDLDTLRWLKPANPDDESWIEDLIVALEQLSGNTKFYNDNPPYFDDYLSEFDGESQ